VPSMPTDFPEQALADARLLSNGGISPTAQIRTITFTGEESVAAGERGPLQLLHALPVLDQQEILATIALYDDAGNQLTKSSRQALQVVEDRLAFVLRYLRRIQEIEEMKGDFISMLVHDLRAPLTGIRGFSSIMANRDLGPLTDDQQEALEHIHHGCDRMLLLIEDMLDVSRLEAGKLQMQCAPVDLRGLIERTVGALDALFREKRLTSTVEIADDLPWAHGDERQLHRVLTNLLSNAIQFSPRGGIIHLSAAPLPLLKGESREQLRIAVTDTGPGIPADQQGKLFTRFQQLSSTRVFRRGSGLGLSICKEIVGLHGGRIWVESPIANGRGSRFVFTLPCD
jgi:signal transduction histidine kinase